MEDDAKTAKSEDYSWVLGLPAPSLSKSARPKQPKKKKPLVNEKNDQATHWNILIINQGQDIGEEVLNYFQNMIKSFENSNGHKWIGKIVLAAGVVFHPILDTENSSASDKDLYRIITLGGTYVMSEDGQVQQSGPLTISCAGPNSDVIGGQVIDRLIAAEDVQVTICAFHINPSEDEEKVSEDEEKV